jgi:glycosyltransferase involved in cell wall biosynthesis
MTLRIAMLCSYYPPHVGGIASQVQGVAQSLSQLGVETHIITRQWETATQAVTHTVESDNVIVHRIAIGGRRWQASPAFIWRSAQLAHSLQPAVIHAHELLLPTTAALLAKRLGGYPLVVTVHSSGVELGECARLQRTTFGDRRVQYVRHAVDCFVAISSAVEADMAAIGIPEERRIVIPNGIDMQRFQPIKPAGKDALRCRLGLPQETLVAYTGRLSSEKRVLPLAQQWSALRQAYPDATLVIIGDGPEMSELSKLQAPGVCLVGSQADVTPFLQAADLFVMPSVSEGFSISTLEALACGLPTVATTVGAIPDLVADGITGTLVAPSDLPALFEALCRLLANRSAWPAMSEAARGDVVQHYSLPSTARRLLDLYQRI